MLKPQPAFPKKSHNWAYSTIHKQPPQNHAKSYEEEADFTSFKIFVYYVFNAIKDQDWVRRPRLLPPNPKGTRAREYYVFHDGMGYRTVDCRSSEAAQEVYPQPWAALRDQSAERGKPDSAAWESS